MTSLGRAAAGARFGRFNPFYSLYRLLTSVRFALVLIGFVAFGALLGVVIPQVSDDIRSSPAAFDAWTQAQVGKFGPFTWGMRRLGLFEVFHSYWFNGLVLFVLLAVTICTANRFPSIWRSIRRPQKRVAETYFTRAHQRAEFSTPADPARIERALRKRHYKLTREVRDGATYLYADRFSWTQLGTFATHLSLILFLTGAVLTKVLGFSQTVEIADGRTAPVFPVRSDNQVIVRSLGAYEGRDAKGNIIAFHSDVVLYRDGAEICRGRVTVNTPLSCDGLSVHQAAFSANGVDLQVRDATTGRVIFDEAHNLSANGAPMPLLRITGADGQVYWDNYLLLAPVQAGSTDFWGTVLDPTGQTILTLFQDGQGQWRAGILHKGVDPAHGDPDFQLTLAPGQSGTGNGRTFTFISLKAAPLGVWQNVPGMERAAMLQLGTSVDGQPFLDMRNMGGGTTSGLPSQADRGTNTANGAAATAADGQPSAAPPAPAAASAQTLAERCGPDRYSSGPDGITVDRCMDNEGNPISLSLKAGQSVQVGNRIYTFVGRKNFTGLIVRKDPGADFIWLATGLLLFGLVVTFYFPRRRIWVKVTPERTYLAGLAERMAKLPEEMRRIGHEAGSPDALPPAPPA